MHNIRCIERDTDARSSEWDIGDMTVTVQQYQSEKPWSLATMQSTFCTVSARGVRPLDVATSSHAQAVRAFMYKAMGHDGPINAEYMV